MNLAIFLDVDKTLTVKIIQEYYAQQLQCKSEYDALEKKFQENKISSRDFGLEIINLYAAKKLTKIKARECAVNVQLQPWTEQLLTLNENPSTDIFLVSSGPNYYIDVLAEKFRLDRGNVLCSRYYFESLEGHISRCDPVDEMQKADFVNRMLNEKNYDYSIGVGDHPQMDGPFISACSIGFLIEPSESHFYAPNIQTIIRHVETIQKTGEKLSTNSSDSSIHLQTIGIKDLFQRLTLGSWLFLVALIGGAYTLGTKFKSIINIFGG